MSSLFQFKASCVDSTDSLDCLRTADAKLLLDASTSIGSANFLGTCTFVPVVDGTFIIERPTVTLKRGRLNGVGF
jgi:carboxylesterase type B